MLAEERFREILKIVNDKKTVTVQELTALLQTSESTIRRDLTTLHQRGALIKVHGGATTAESETMTRDADLSLRSTLNKEAKAVIGKYAASLIREDDFVYLDAGSSVDVMIDYITESGALYVTNSVSHAQKLLKKGMRVFLIGGGVKGGYRGNRRSRSGRRSEKVSFYKRLLRNERGGCSFRLYDAGYYRGSCKRKGNAAMQKKLCIVEFIQNQSNFIGHLCCFQSAQLITTKLQDESYKKYTNIMEVQ